MREKLLFICSANRQRSPTAESLLRGSQVYEARSAGTSEYARIKVTAGLVGWADRIFLMEKRHRTLLARRFAGVLQEKPKPLIVLDIPDEYAFMEPALVSILHVRLAPHLEHLSLPD